MKTKVKVNQNPEEEEQYSYKEIQTLQNHGINVADIAKLKMSGLNTVLSVLMATRKELLNIKGINDAKADKIQEAAKKIQNVGFMTGIQISDKRKQVVRITTGSQAFDQMLGGGIQTMSITQAYGQFRTGKTQLAHTLCVTSQLGLDKRGGAGRVIFIDTQGTFRPQRIYKIAQRFGLDGEQALDNIRYARAYTVQHLSQLITISAAMMMETNHALIIVDSIMACFRTDFSGRGQLSERQQILGKVLSKLMKLAQQFNVAVYLTNQVMADPSTSMAHMDPRKPVGGHVLAHASTSRLYFKKGKGDERIAKLTDSPWLAESQCIFVVSEGGISDQK